MLYKTLKFFKCSGVLTHLNIKEWSFTENNNIVVILLRKLSWEEFLWDIWFGTL